MSCHVQLWTDMFWEVYIFDRIDKINGIILVILS